MKGKHVAGTGGRRRASLLGIAILAGIALVVLAAHLLLAWRLDTKHLRRRLETAVAAGTDSLYLVRIGSSHFSLLGRSFRITGLELYPDTAAFRRRAKAGPELEPHTRYVFSAASFRAEGIGLWRFFRRQISVSSATIDSLHLEILVDRTKALGPQTPVKLPHQSLQTGKPLHIEQLRLEHSEILFSERAIDGSRFGTIPFTELEAVITNFSNDPLLMSRAKACEIDVRGRFAGAAPLLVRFEYDLSAPRLNLAYRGSIGRMSAKALNPFLVSMEGVRIRDGQLDSAAFQVDVRDDVARGQLLLLYHDLEIETLDKVTRDRDLSDALNTFIFNHFKLDTHNPHEGKPPLLAPLQHRRLPETPLFKFIWLTLRDGVFQTLGL